MDGITYAITGNVEGTARGRGKVKRVACHLCHERGLLNVECVSQGLGRHWRYFEPQSRSNEPLEEHLCGGESFDWQLEKLPSVVPSDQVVRSEW